MQVLGIAGPAERLFLPSFYRPLSEPEAITSCAVLHLGVLMFVVSVVVGIGTRTCQQGQGSQGG
jgi:hypothetical protein